MEIDVRELNFKNLKFHSRIEAGRYKRGETIQANENVSLTSAGKDENKYLIKASVADRNDIYKTTLKINGEDIVSAECTCLDYYKGHLCKHIIATYLETLNPHNKETYQERKIKVEKKIEDSKEKMKRLVEERLYNEKYEIGIDLIKTFKNADRRMQGTHLLDLYELSMLMEETKNKIKTELSTNIKIDFSIEFCDFDTLVIKFKIGTTRMYILNDFNLFYNGYLNNSEIYLGKQLRFIPKRENFSEESKWLFDLIIEYCEILNDYSKFESSNFSSKEIYLKSNKIDKFFNQLINQTVSYFDGEARQNELVTVVDEKLNINYIIEKEKVSIHNPYYNYWNDAYSVESDEYVLKLELLDYEFCYTKQYVYILHNYKIYRMKNNNNLPEMLTLFFNQNFVLIPEDKLEEFMRFVTPKVDITLNNLPEAIEKEVLIVEKLASKVLLDLDDKGNILLELKFCYQNYEFNILEKDYENYVAEHNIIRNIPEESDVVKRIFQDGFTFSAGKKEFIMKEADNIYEFLSYKIEGYMNDFEVLATDKFKSKEIKRPKLSSVGVKIDNGLLELDISKINIDISEIKSILRDYSIKKKYYKLKNGDFLDLTQNEDLNFLSEIAMTLDVDYTQLKTGIAKLPISRSFYLEKLIGSNAKINVFKNEEFMELVGLSENIDIFDEIKLDETFEIKLRDYQKVGYKWLKTLQMYNFGGILADDMGLGKTLQIIAVLNSELKNENKRPSIVVCPSTLVLNWKFEVEKWCPAMNVLIITGNADERKEKIEGYKNYDLLVTSYDLLKRDVENYEGKHFQFVIADEAQYIKNFNTQNATSLKSLNGETKFALTGTPIENSVAELWSIFDFIMPGYLYNYNKFKKKFEEPILKYEDTEMLNRLKKLISPFILRRVKQDVLAELPEKNVTIMKSEMETEQEKLYLSYLSQTRKEIAEELSDSTFEKSKFKILMLLTRLRQICCHSSLFIENYNGDSGKLRQCINLVVAAIESGHKILLFSSHTSMFEIIETELKKLNINYFKLIGETPVNKRVEMVEEFNRDEDVKVFLISLKAGGTGLNLTSADVVIHYDPWWNLSSENQATDRAYRIGQKNSVQVYKLITSNSIEEKINMMQERKEKLAKDVLSTEETFISKLSKEEILDLFK